MTIWHDNMTHVKREKFWRKRKCKGARGVNGNRFSKALVLSRVGGDTTLIYLQHIYVTLGS